MGKRDKKICYGSLSTPVGTVFVSASARGVCDVTFGSTLGAVYRRRLSERAEQVSRDHSVVAQALDELDAYFSGERQNFSVSVDLRGVTEFTARVLCETCRIPFGEFRTYGDIARSIGTPSASRAVGGALGRNPIPVIIPCHRVVARGGLLGGFTGGLRIKCALLRIEGKVVA